MAAPGDSSKYLIKTFDHIDEYNAFIETLEAADEIILVFDGKEYQYDRSGLG